MNEITSAIGACLPVFIMFGPLFILAEANTSASEMSPISWGAIFLATAFAYNIFKLLSEFVSLKIRAARPSTNNCPVNSSTVESIGNLSESVGQLAEMMKTQIKLKELEDRYRNDDLKEIKEKVEKILRLNYAGQQSHRRTRNNPDSSD